MNADARERLLQSGLLASFVSLHRGKWGHDEWLVCLNLVQAKFGALDADEVGYLLEQEKARYQERASANPDNKANMPAQGAALVQALPGGTLGPHPLEQLIKLLQGQLQRAAGPGPTPTDLPIIPGFPLAVPPEAREALAELARDVARDLGEKARGIPWQGWAAAGGAALSAALTGTILWLVLKPKGEAQGGGARLASSAVGHPQPPESFQE